MFRSLNTILFFYVVAGVVLFGSAGRLNLPFFWAYLLLVVLFSIFVVVLLSRRSPSLLKERRKPGPGEQDRLFKPATVVRSLTLVDLRTRRGALPLVSSLSILTTILRLAPRGRRVLVCCLGYAGKRLFLVSRTLAV